MLPNSRYMVYRVMKPETLEAIAQAVGVPIMEAARIPGKTRSTYRAWTHAGLCYEMLVSGERAMQASRVARLDRKIAVPA